MLRFCSSFCADRASAPPSVHDHPAWLISSHTFSNVSQELGSSDWFGSVCGQYPIQKPQLEAFETFTATLKQAAIAFAAVAATNVILALKQTGFNPSNPVEVLGKITVGNFSLWADSVVVAALTWYAAGAFEVLKAKGGNQQPLVFQGISRLTLVLQQFGIAAAALGAVHMLEAASIFPPITRIAALAFISVSATRGLLLRFLASRHRAARGGIIPGMIAAVRAREASGIPLWERRAMRLVLGHLYWFNIPSAEDGRKPMPQTGKEDMDKLTSSVQGSMDESPATDKGEGDEGGGPPAYFFNRAELQIVRICMDALHFAGFALGSQGIATGILGVACVGQGNFLRAYSMLSNGSTKVFTSMLLFKSSNAFDRTFVIPSCHVCNLVDGVGPGGLTDLFHKLTLFSWAVVASQLLPLALPWLQGSPIGQTLAMNAVGDYLIQGLTAAQNLLAGI